MRRLTGRRKKSRIITTDNSPRFGRRVLPRAWHNTGSPESESLDGVSYFGPYRRVLMQRFPFSVYYEVANDHIRVVAVAHQHRKPGYWKKRLTLNNE